MNDYSAFTHQLEYRVKFFMRNPELVIAMLDADRAGFRMYDRIVPHTWNIVANCSIPKDGYVIYRSDDPFLPREIERVATFIGEIDKVIDVMRSAPTEL